MSGLNQRFTKPSGPNRPREFESHILRPYKIPLLGGYFIGRRMSKTLMRLTMRFEKRSDVAKQQASCGQEHLVDLESQTNKYT